MSAEMATLAARAERAEALVESFTHAWGVLQMRRLAAAQSLYEHLPASWRELVEPPPGLRLRSAAASSRRTAFTKKNVCVLLRVLCLGRAQCFVVLFWFMLAHK
eukprot:63047-Alexandrium_andersonii.AAC.1